MIVHAVLFEPRSDLSESARQQILDDLHRAAASIPSIRKVRLGERLRHGLPGYEQSMRTDYRYALLVEFDDRAGLEEYLRHPLHESIGRHFTAASSSALAYDYDVEDL